MDKSEKRLTPYARLVITLIAVILSLLVLTALAGLAIAEPWRADDAAGESVPPVSDMGVTELAVGDEYVFDLDLDVNEVISSIDSSEPRVIEPGGCSVKANGMFSPVSVTVTTREAVMTGQNKRIVFFGRDYSSAYYNLRRTLRTLLGVSDGYTLPSELRIINIYKYTFRVTSCPDTVLDGVTLSDGSYTDIDIPPESDFYTVLRVDPRELLYGSLLTGSSYRFFALSPGKAEATVLTGFYMEVDDETYAEYIAGGGNANPQHPRQLFVPVRRTVINFEILPEEVAR